MVKLNVTIRASSLIEVLVSMLILLIITGMVLLFISRISNKYNHYNNVKALILLQNEIELTKGSAIKEIDYNYSSNGIKVKKTVKPYRDNPRLNVIIVEAFGADSNRIAIRKKVIVNNGKTE